MSVNDFTPLVVSGSPRERGLAIAKAGHAVRDDIVARVSNGMVLTDAEADWVDAVWDAQLTHLPEMCELISGIAEGLGMGVRELFNRHVNYALEDRRNAPEPDPDGCSVFAVRTGNGVLVSKNRDNPPWYKPLQSLIHQSDPAWGGREVACISAFGSSPTASSGINSDGLCMVDTAVRTADLGIGVLRYYLMDAILYRCGDVPEAVEFIRSLPHLGGGNIVIGDAAGRMAALEISNSKVTVEDDAGRGWVARTNHFLDPHQAARLMTVPGSEARLDSEARLAYLNERLSPGVGDWTAADCMTILAYHGDEGHAALCRHGDTTLTLSGTVYDAVGGSLTQSVGTPCDDKWLRSRFDPEG